MKVLFWIFIGMFLFGVLMGPLGVGLLAFAYAVLIYWADNKFKALDDAYNNSPSNPQEPPCTLQCLTDKEQECSGDRI